MIREWTFDTSMAMRIDRDTGDENESRGTITISLIRSDPRTPLPVYAGCEQLDGRLRAFVPVEFDRVVFDKSDHDHGDEDRR